MPFGPGTAWFLSERERSFAITRIKIDGARYVHHTYGPDGQETTSERLSKRDVIETAKDWKLWYVLFFNICASVPGQAFSVFLPLIVKGLGFASIKANLVSDKITVMPIATLNLLDVCTTISLWRCWIVHLRTPLRSRVSLQLQNLTFQNVNPALERNVVFISSAV